MRIPANGLRGVALREAVTEYRAIIDLVRETLRTKLFPVPVANGDRGWVDMEAIYPDHVVVRWEGKLYSYPYTLAGDQVTFGEATAVVEQFVPLQEAAPAGPSSFIEAVDGETGSQYLIWVIRSGVSLNGVDYPDVVLREAAPLFDGARVFVKSDTDHIKGAGKDVRNLVAGLSQPRFVEAANGERAGIQALMTVIDPAEPIAVKMREAHKRRLSGLFGFSIDAGGYTAKAPKGSRAQRVAKSITQVSSVDLIVEPGAGGEVIRLIEAANPTQHHQEQDAMREKLLKFIEAKAPHLLAKLNEAASDDEVEAAYREAVALEAKGQSGQRFTESADAAVERIRMAEARATARATILGSTLPQPAKDKLLKEFDARERFVEADVATAIQGERDYLARFAESGTVRVPFGAFETEDRSVKMKDMLDAFFDPTHKDHRAVGSFREAYVEMTGDRGVTGLLANCDRARMAESLGTFREALDSSSWALALGDSITRRMLADYRLGSQYDIYKPLVNTVPVRDFRTQERTRIGGYGDLPIVAQSGDYTALNSPDDEKASYAVAKRGGTESITLEMVANDDVGVIRAIPTKLSRAAKRTLAKFVMDFLRTNPAIYDSKALFHVDHGNLGTAPLSAASVAAARLAMLKQTEPGSGEQLGIPLKYLWVPPELQEAAADLFRRNTNNDETFIQTLKPTIVPVWYWTDANDWCASADPMDIPTIELAFFNGAEEPELFVQDAPTMGSVFSKDTITYKIRHIYGGNVMDHRGLYKGVVA